MGRRGSRPYRASGANCVLVRTSSTSSLITQYTSTSTAACSTDLTTSSNFRSFDSGSLSLAATPGTDSRKLSRWIQNPNGIASLSPRVAESATLPWVKAREWNPTLKGLQQPGSRSQGKRCNPCRVDPIVRSSTRRSRCHRQRRAE